MSGRGTVTFRIEPGTNTGWRIVGSDGDVYYYALYYETAVAKLPQLEALLTAAE